MIKKCGQPYGKNLFILIKKDVFSLTTNKCGHLYDKICLALLQRNVVGSMISYGEACDKNFG